MKKATRELPFAAAGVSIAVAVGLMAMGLLMVKDSRGEMADLVAVAARAERAELERFAGGAPDRCVYAAPGRELCRWRIEGQVIASSGGRPAAGAVNLVCELPVEAPGARGSCFVREQAAGEPEQAAGEPELPPVSAAGDPSQRARDAASFLAEARSVAELSLLVGDAPSACHTVYAAQMCRWSLDAGSPERDRLAALAEDEDAELELRCLIPLEGVARPLQSCAVVSVQ